MSNQKNKFLKFSLFLFLVFFLVPGLERASAYELHFSGPTNEVRVGDVFIVEALVSSPRSSINVVDGRILLESSKLEVKEFSTGGSIFNIWAREPSFSNSAGQASFIGGATNGFNTEKGLILSLILEAKTVGTTTLSFSPGSVLLAEDGRGTDIIPKLTSKTFEILPALEGVSPRDEWRERVSGDTTPPVFEEAIVARSQQLFENKYFVSFFATDVGSGVLYYQVKEGGGDFLHAESPYVLKDQSLEGTIVVRAVDVSGNLTEINPEFAPEGSFFASKYLWLSGILILLLLVWLFSRRKRRKATRDSI